MGGEHVHRPRQVLQGAHLPLMERHVVGPVLDGADLRHRFEELEERLRRIALAGRQRILERDDRQIGRRLGYALEMRDRHLGILPEGERPRWEHQQRRAASRLPSAQTPCTTGNRSPTSSAAISITRRCSSKVQEATSVEWAFTVIAESPVVALTCRRWARKLVSSMARSASNGSSTAGMTPAGTKAEWRGIGDLLRMRRNRRGAGGTLGSLDRPTGGAGQNPQIAGFFSRRPVLQVSVVAPIIGFGASRRPTGI